MTIGKTFICAAALIVSASPAAAQGPPPGPQVVISAAAIKAMVASKPKAKSPLMARLRTIRKPAIAATKSTPAAPTSVGEIGRKGSR